jgi:conjugative transfer signal peptidase TraF
MTAAAALVMAISTGRALMPYRLIYNASGSVPTGFYVANGRRAPRRGALMLVALPEPWRQLAAQRGYLPRDILALKRIVGAPGDRLCARGAQIFLNERWVAARAARDAANRPMPVWTGCFRLAADQWFLLNPAPQSFDGRYFGGVPASALRAEIVPL